MSISFSKITPCIWLDDQAEEAAAFYVRTFPDGRIVATSRYPESIDNSGGRPTLHRAQRRTPLSC